MQFQCYGKAWLDMNYVFAAFCGKGTASWSFNTTRRLEEGIKCLFSNSGIVAG